jgi:hypothetical protein
MKGWSTRRFTLIPVQHSLLGQQDKNGALQHNNRGYQCYPSQQTVSMQAV